MYNVCTKVDCEHVLLLLHVAYYSSLTSHTGRDENNAFALKKQLTKSCKTLR